MLTFKQLEGVLEIRQAVRELFLRGPARPLVCSRPRSRQRFDRRTGAVEPALDFVELGVRRRPLREHDPRFAPGSVDPAPATRWPSRSPRGRCRRGRWRRPPRLKEASAARQPLHSAGKLRDRPARLSPSFSACSCSDRPPARSRAPACLPGRPARADHLDQAIRQRILGADPWAARVPRPSGRPGPAGLPPAGRPASAPASAPHSERGQAACCQTRSARPPSRWSNWSRTHPGSSPSAAPC